MRQVDASATLDADQARTAANGVKGMIPVGRPFLDYVLSALADAGMADVCLVIGPEHDAIRQRYSSDLRPARIRVTFAIQREPRGTGDALAAARDFAGTDAFLTLNADNYYPADAYRLLAELDGPGLIGFTSQGLLAEGNVPADRLRRFALVTADRDGYLREIIEKPDDAFYEGAIGHSLISMNLWAFGPAIFEACERLAPSPRGELEIQDAVRIAVAELGERFRIIPYGGGVLDLSTQRDIAVVTARLRGVDVRL